MTIEGFTLMYAGSPLRFSAIRLDFKDELASGVFGEKNNKTVSQTIEHRRYAHLKAAVYASYLDALHQPLGLFLRELKSKGDLFYQRFLNPHGDLQYCVFRLANRDDHGKRGVYAYRVDQSLTYIGRCKATMKKRIDQGYGKIHPKNCYLDGQSTNCRLNALITEARGHVSLGLYELHVATDIETVERSLIQQYRPPWNVQIA